MVLESLEDFKKEIATIIHKVPGTVSWTVTMLGTSHLVMRMIYLVQFQTVIPLTCALSNLNFISKFLKKELFFLFNTSTHR